MAIRVNFKDAKKWLIKKNLYYFIKEMWDSYETAPFVDSWLIEYQSECFMYSVKHFLPKYVWGDWISDEEYEKIKDLAEKDPQGVGIRPSCPVRDKIFEGEHVRNHDWNIGPRHMKSTIHNICGPTWLGINTPITVASTSHNQNLSTEMNTKRQKLLQSAKFSYYFGKDVELKLKKDSATELELLNGTKLYSVPMVSFTGFGADVIIADDLISADNARKGAAVLQNVLSFFRDTLPTRRNNPKTSVIWQIQQRVGLGDISGTIKDDKNLSQIYSHTELPSIFPKDDAVIFPCSGKVKYIRKGEPLWKERFGDYTNLKMAMTEAEFNTQYLQDPSESDLNIVKKDYIHWVDEKFVNEFIPMSEFHYASHDCTVKDAKTNDFHGFTEGYSRGNTLLITDAWEKHMGYAKEKELMENLEIVSPGIIQVIEDKANGSSLLQDLKDSVPGLDDFDPGSRGKPERLELAAVHMKNSNVLFADTPGVHTLVDRLLRYPLVEHDDITDSCSQLILYHFAARKLGVYTNSFSYQNVIHEQEEPKSYLSYAANLSGDTIKVLAISSDPREDKYIVEKEWIFKGLGAFEDFYQEVAGNIFLDVSKNNTLSRICTRCYTLIRFNETTDEFDKSLSLLKTGFYNKRVFVRADCKQTVNDISKLRITNNSKESGENKLENLDEGMEKCLRALITNTKGVNGLWY